MKDEETVKYYDLLDEIEKLCRTRGELSLIEVEKMALAQDIRPSLILDELAITAGFSVDYALGKVICPTLWLRLRTLIAP